jgi:short-subunit dehydrogenase involved in D-alanine esterification of teichoic acids
MSGTRPRPDQCEETMIEVIEMIAPTVAIVVITVFALWLDRR